ncbi:MAG: hypothetical protein QOI39_4310 [Mycobacterium sp.]|jgi:hypothetical protein|nr:hypothetical protein [Mycobacterium sp.]
MTQDDAERVAWPSWWAEGKASGERWWKERAEITEREAFERLFPDQPRMGLSYRCLETADRIESGELSGMWTTFWEWIAAERPAGNDIQQKRWLAGFVHGVMQPETQIPTT